MRLGRGRSKKCRQFQPRLVAAADRHTVTDLTLRRHLRSCRNCRAEFNQHRTIGRALRGLTSANVAPPLPSSNRRRLRLRRHPQHREAGLVGLAAALVVLSAVGITTRRRA